MRILSVVTLISPTGEYGGPVRVALNQARALREAGHHVTVAGATRGFEVPPTEFDGTPVRLFPAVTVLPGAGFAGLAAPGLQRWLRTTAGEFDVIHVHAARDLVTLPAAALARRRGMPYVIQTHGMIDVSRNPLAVPLDSLLTRRVLRGAKVVFYLTEHERADIEAVAAGIPQLQELPNGVPLSEPTVPSPRREVLYLARLAPRKRPLTFVEAAAALTSEHPDVEFTLVGPDEGEAAAVRDLIARAGITDRVRWEGPLPPEQTIERMRHASLYVLPSVDEPYPMSVLEAMSVGLPVIVTDSNGLAAAVEKVGSGIVVDASVAELTRAIGQLLDDPERARAMGAAGRDATRTDFGMPAIAAALELAYSV